MKYPIQSKVPARRRRLAAALAVAAWLVLAVSPVAFAQTDAEKAIIQGIDFEQNLNATIPLDTRFTDEAGREVQLGQYFGKRPVVLTLVYYECPMLCTEVLNGWLRTMQEMQFTAGQEYDVVTVSIDPGETPALAAEKRDEYLRRYGRTVTPDTWHFLTGREEEIKRLADSVGYKYVYDKVTDQYAHPSGVVVLTPAGKVSHYFYGVQYNAKDVRLGLVEASANKKLAIDVVKLVQLKGAPFEMLSRYLKLIQVQRQDFNGRVITVRGDDVRSIAAMLDVPVDQVGARLDALDLLFQPL